MNKLLILFLLTIFFSLSSNITFAISDPAAVYCTQMGYTYNIVKTQQGEYGVCTFPDGSQCEEWQSLEGKCGNKYSYCIMNGYDIKMMTDGKNPYSTEYAVCVPKASGQKQISVTDILSIKSDITPESIPSSSTSSSTVSSTSSSASSLTSLPSSFDWRNNNGNWMTSVKNQGGCGSCWIFAAVGTVEAKIKIEKNTPNNNPDLSEQDIISCGKWGGCSGFLPVAALAYIRYTGVVDESCFIYTASDSTPCSNRCSDWQNRLTKIADYGDNVPATSISDIKSYLINKGPLTTVIAMSGSFDNKGIYTCSGSPAQNHAIVLVGYNDAGGYWIAKNSWGSTWNGDGYFKIYYGSCSIEPYLYVYATGQINGVCNKDVGASLNCDGKLPNSMWCDGPLKKSCDSVCQYSEVCDSKCSSQPNCGGRTPGKTWCDGNTKKGCDATCRYSETICPTRLEDTDGGINPFVKGTCYYQTGCANDMCQGIISTDVCTDSTNLDEYYISDSSNYITHINCQSYGSKYICYAGACIPSGGKGGCAKGCYLLAVGPYIMNVDIEPMLSTVSAILVIIEIVILMTIYNRLKHTKRKRK